MDLELLRLARALKGRADVPEFYRVVMRELHWTKRADGKVEWSMSDHESTRHARGHSHDLGRLYAGLDSARRGYLVQRREMLHRVKHSRFMGNPEMAIDEATEKKWLESLKVVRVYVFDGETVSVDQPHDS